MDAIKFTLDKSSQAKPMAAGAPEPGKVKAPQSQEEMNAQMVCAIDNPDDCEMCGA